MALRGIAGGSGSGVTSITGTANQIVVTPTTGASVASLATNTALPGAPTAATATAGTNTTQIASTAFVTTAVSNAIAGVNPAVAVNAATVAASDTSGLTYNNGVAGIGATFTGSNNTPLIVDGFTFTALNQRLLVKNDTQAPSGAFNGIYYVTQVQTAILPPILTRALDYDQPSDINGTGAIPVISGTVNGSTQWVITSTVNTIGTDPLTYTQFSLNPSTLITVIGQSNLPMIVAGSGSMANNGALTLTTTMGRIYASAYLFLPASAISAGSSAAWYYTTFSSGSVGTVFNNTYVSGTPVIPASPTAFATTGPGAYTGSSSAQTAYSLSIAGNSINMNGGIQANLAVSYTNSAGSKTISFSYGGTNFGSIVPSTTAAGAFIWGFKNRGVTNSQVSLTSPTTAPFGVGSGTLNYGTVDTTSAQTLGVSLTNATPASNNVTLETITVQLLPGVV